MDVFYAPLMDRELDQLSVLSLLRVAEHGMICGYHRIEVEYNITDQARNLIAAAFLGAATNPDDILVMLDCDHFYAANIVEQLARWSKPVVGALYFNRRPPYAPMFFHRRNGKLEKPHKWTKGLNECAIVGTGAIAIQRRAFDTLAEKGFKAPYFRYVYQEGARERATEDIYFGQICEQAGVQHYVDGSTIIPHMQMVGIAEDAYQAHRQQREE